MADIFDLFKKIEKAPAAPSAPISFIVAGLGNPGAQYAATRHNAGFIALDYLCDKHGWKIDRSRFKALSGEVTVGTRRGLLLKPQTFMNASGESVREAAEFYKISPENIIVICDDISLEPGKMRIRRKGSDGGQKGLRSIIEQLGTDGFARIRMGVGAKPHPDYDLADWVLGVMPEADRKLFSEALAKLDEGLSLMLEGNIDKAMNICN